MSCRQPKPAPKKDTPNSSSTTSGRILKKQNRERRAWMKRKPKTSASRIRTSPPRRISRLATIPRSTARHPATLPVVIGVPTEAAIAVETAVQIVAVTVAAIGKTLVDAAAEVVLAAVVD